MKAIGIAFALALAGVASSIALVPSTASAQSVQIGPGGVRIGPNRPDRWERRRERCRVVIEHRRNRFGERVTERRRICRD
jgi:hypothetical protein